MNTTRSEISTFDGIFNFNDAIEARETCRVAQQINNYFWILLPVGVPVNILAILTTLSMQSLSPATFFVALLAFFDGSALVVKSVYWLLFNYEVSVGTIGCKMEFLSTYLSTVANWMLVLICFERFISVCYPLKKISVFTKRRSYISAVIVSGVFMVFYGAIYIVMRGISGNTCGTIGYYKTFWVTSYYWMTNALFLFIPFLMILVFTGGIISGLYRSRRDRRVLMRREGGQETGIPMSVKNNQRLVTEVERVELAITVMMVMAAVLFLVFSLPACVYYLLRNSSFDDGCLSKTDTYWTIYRQVQYLLVDTTHALNFFVYFFTARRFRSHLFKLLRCKVCKKKKYQHTVSSQLSSSSKSNSNVCLHQIK